MTNNNEGSSTSVDMAVLPTEIPSSSSVKCEIINDDMTEKITIESESDSSDSSDDDEKLMKLKIKLHELKQAKRKRKSSNTH